MSDHRPGTEELLRFIVGEGLDAQRRCAIAAALLADATLRAQHDRLAVALGAAVRARADVEPKDGYEQRLWSRIAPQLPTARADRPVRRPWHPAFAWAAVLLLGVATAWWLRPAAPPTSLPSPGENQWFAADAGSRILDRELATYFDAAASVLDAVPTEPAALAQRANALAQRNRLYAAAARRSGRTVDAALLQQLSEPLGALAMGTTPLESPEDLERLAFQSRGLARRSRSASLPDLSDRRS